MQQETVLVDDSVEVADSACFKLSSSNMKAFALGMLDLHFDAVKTVRLQNFEQIVVLTKKMNSGKDEYEIRGTEVTLSLSERTLTRLLQISTDVALGRKFGVSHADFDFYKSKGMAAFRFAVKFRQDLYEWKDRPHSSEVDAFAQEWDADKKKRLD